MAREDIIRAAVQKEAEERLPQPKHKMKLGALGALCLLLAVFLQLSFVLVLIGMFPTAIAHLIDNTKNRVKYQCVLACNISGLLPFVAELLSRGNEKQQIQALMSDPKTLFVIYASAGFGFLLVNASPYMAAWFVKSINVRKAKYIYQVQEQLVDEWGPEIMQTLPK